MLIQSAHALADRRPIADAPEALDPYMTDPVAVRALIGIEQGRIPEPTGNTAPAPATLS